MIYYLSGTLQGIGEDYLVIDVQGIGIKVLTTISVIQKYRQMGAQVKIYTYMQTREDGIFLFGFSTNEEKNLFENLISVSGVGPKGAISLLNSLGYENLINSIINEDENSLSTAQGIGKKTAKRIILEAKDKLRKAQSLFSLEQQPSVEAIEGLVALGYSRNEAAIVVDKIQKAGILSKTEDIIKASLRELAQKK